MLHWEVQTRRIFTEFVDLCIVVKQMVAPSYLRQLSGAPVMCFVYSASSIGGFERGF